MRRPLVRGRGLKHLNSISAGNSKSSRPLVRGRGLKLENGIKAATDALSPPCEGAWIEATLHQQADTTYSRRPLVRGRGLKHIPKYTIDLADSRPLVRGRGLKHHSRNIQPCPNLSPPCEGAWIEA